MAKDLEARAKFANTVRRQMVFWLSAVAVLVLLLYVFADILLPFVAGMALAYFLDPVADWLESKGLGRLTATILIMVSFLVVFILTLMVVIPVLVTQTAGFLDKLPTLVTGLQEIIASRDDSWLRTLGINTESLRENLGSLVTEGAGWVATVVQQLWASGKSLINVVSLLVVTPVVAFYLLYDWDHMVAKVDSWLPLEHRDTVRGIVSDINSAIAAFVRGQGTVCIFLGCFYAVLLTLAGLNFGLLIGLFAGLISFIPFVGSIVGLVLSVGVALVQFWPDYITVGIVAAIFALGQFLEGNFLQPKLVGDSVGLHPVWLMFALFAFGSLFGFTGMLVAVPASAAIAVILRFALARYLESDYYKGTD